MNELVGVDLAEAIESKIDRSKWRLMKFSDLAENIVEKVVPKDSGLKHYIGLEHLDSGSLHIKRFGETESLVGDKLRIYKGDLIFAKRNAYLKRVAIAEFDAVASAHSMVLRAKPNNVLPEFLPFFMLSEAFWQRAIEISVGSLSPTINWKALAKQEFMIPPLEQQEQIAELLWAGDEAIQASVKLGNELTKLKEAALHEVFDRQKCRTLTISQVSTNLDNRRKPIKSSLREAGETPYYGASGIVDYVKGYLFDEPVLLISEDGENLNSRKLPIAYKVDGKCWVNNHAHVIRVENESRYLLCEYLNYSDLSDFITGGTRPKITKGMLNDIPVFLPEKEESDAAERKLRAIDDSKIESDNLLMQQRKLNKSLINQIF